MPHKPAPVRFPPAQVKELILKMPVKIEEEVYIQKKEELKENKREGREIKREDLIREIKEILRKEERKEQESGTKTMTEHIVREISVAPIAPESDTGEALEGQLNLGDNMLPGLGENVGSILTNVKVMVNIQ